MRHIDWSEQQSASEPDEQQKELDGQQPPIPVAFRQQVEPLGQHPVGEPEQQMEPAKLSAQQGACGGLLLGQQVP